MHKLMHCSHQPCHELLRHSPRSLHKLSHTLRSHTHHNSLSASSTTSHPMPSIKKQTFTLTFGDCAENHVGMQKIGKLAPQGFTQQDLHDAKRRFEAQSLKCELYDLSENLPDSVECAQEAHVLVVRGALDAGILVQDKSSKNFFEEQDALEKDAKAFMYGRVVEKRARHNLCFSAEGQEPDYEKGKGRVVAFSDVPLLEALREALPTYFGEKARELQVEGNYYYDVSQCGIGFHGDAERRKVIGVRLGATLPLHFQWFQNSKPIGKRLALDIAGGDLYCFSEKATGFDWKKRNICTLRHAAGCKKFLVIKDSSGKKRKRVTGGENGKGKKSREE